MMSSGSRSGTKYGLPRIAFLDSFCLGSLFWIVVHGRSLQEVWVFDSLTSTQERVVALLASFGICSAKWRVVDVNIGRIPPEDGAISRLVAERAALQMSSRIRDALKNVGLLASFGDMWPQDHLLLYLLKPLELELTHECRRVLLCAWLHGSGRLREEKAVLVLRRRYWDDHLKDFARKRGLDYHAYFDLGGQAVSVARRSWNAAVRGGGRIAGFLSGVRGRVISRKAGTETKVKPVSRQQEASPSPRRALAVKYWHRKLSLGRSHRTEFFFCDPGDDIQLFVYDVNRTHPLSEDEIHALRKWNIRCHGQAPGVPCWLRTRSYFKLLAKHSRTFALSALRSSLRLDKHYFWVLVRLMHLLVEFTYRMDYYAATNTVMIVGSQFSLSVAETLAIRALGGVSVAYQTSISDLILPIRASLAGESVRLVFSQHFAELAKQADPPASEDVVVGCLGEGPVEGEISAWAAALRAELEEAGARFIFSVFDEAYVDRWDMFTTVEDASREYEWLFQWILEDERIGMIVKPKKWWLFQQLLDRLSPLDEQVMATGRVKVLFSEDLVGHVFPAQAALASDLCVGKILGGTSAFECWLAGTPSVVIDNVGHYAHPLHDLAGGSVVFESWRDVRELVERGLEEGSLPEGIGNWSGFASFFDPYIDGKGAERMNRFVKRAFKMLDEGATAEKAILFAKDGLGQ